MPDTQEATTERLSRSYGRLAPLLDAIQAAHTLGLTDITVTSVPGRTHANGPKYVLYHLDASKPDHASVRWVDPDSIDEVA